MDSVDQRSECTSVQSDIGQRCAKNVNGSCLPAISLILLREIYRPQSLWKPESEIHLKLGERKFALRKNNFLNQFVDLFSFLRTLQYTYDFF